MINKLRMNKATKINIIQKDRGDTAKYATNGAQKIIKSTAITIKDMITRADILFFFIS
jgi:hypothetical protein